MTNTFLDNFASLWLQSEFLSDLNKTDKPKDIIFKKTSRCIDHEYSSNDFVEFLNSCRGY